MGGGSLLASSRDFTTSRTKITRRSCSCSNLSIADEMSVASSAFAVDRRDNSEIKLNADNEADE